MNAHTFLQRYAALDAALVNAGFPGTSPWWRREIERFARSGCRRWIVRAGRRAGKSSTLCRLAIAWAWFGEWAIAPGDTATIPFVSISKDEASARLKTIAAILDALGLPYERRGDEIEMSGARSVVFKVQACTTNAVVGFTSIAVFGDEAARWESRDTGANPAQEVVASLAPTLATQEHGFMVLSSSPWSTVDYHADLFERGNDAHQITSFGATWECNPTLTEERTRALEPDPRVWLREYAAVPSDAVSAAFDNDEIDRAFELAEPSDLGVSWIVLDPSALRNDRFTVARARFSAAGALRIDNVHGFDAGTDLAVVGAHIRDLMDRTGAHLVFSDDRETTWIEREIGGSLVPIPWSNASKVDAVSRLRALLREGKLSIESHDLMRRELHAFEQKILPSGAMTFAGRRGGHDDFVALLLTAMHAVEAGHVEADGETRAEKWARVSDAIDRAWGPQASDYVYTGLWGER